MATIEADPTIKELELAGFSSWPAERTIVDGSWQIRLSPKLPYKRTNSINCLDMDDNTDVAQRVERVMDVFSNADVQPTLRSTPLTPPALIDACSKAGWSTPFSESVVMTSPLISQWTRHKFEASDSPTASWVEDYITLAVGKTIDRTTISQILQSISKPIQFLRAWDAESERCLGVAVSVVQQNLVGLLGLAIAKDARRKGVGRDLSKAALGWGFSKGARTAWLQVEADNTPARKLYDQLGFAEKYRYAYHNFQT